MLNNTTKKITRAGIIAGLYVVLSLAVFPIASGAIQFRLSEGLTLLPLIYVEAVPAIFVGCMLINLITGCALLDVVFGSLITLVAGVMTLVAGKFIKKVWLKILVGGLFPVLLNAFLLPLIWLVCYGTGEYMYILQVAFLLVGQTVCVYVFGSVCVKTVNRLQGKGIAFLE